jgi:hypothetical protein
MESDGMRSARNNVHRRAHSGRSSHESSRAEQRLFQSADRGRSSDLRACGLDVGRFLLHAASRPADSCRRTSANGIVRSHLPLRGSSGLTPDSLLGLAHVVGTAIRHKIWCFNRRVNVSPTSALASQAVSFRATCPISVARHWPSGVGCSDLQNMVVSGGFALQTIER